MQVTIATQNRPDIDRDHNLRTPERVASEKHINPDGEHETWRDEEIRAVYDRIFGDTLEEYNKKQTRNDRKIKDYYDHISKDKKKQPVYEMIAGVYNTELDRDTKYKILREFCDSWEMRNPNLVCVGMYWHADEKGQEHVHIDYVPVGTKYSKGMAVQNSLTKALNEMALKLSTATLPHRCNGKRGRILSLNRYATHILLMSFIRMRKDLIMIKTHLLSTGR